jgi:hypothetical protein
LLVDGGFFKIKDLKKKNHMKLVGHIFTKCVKSYILTLFQVGQDEIELFLEQKDENCYSYYNYFMDLA